MIINILKNIIYAGHTSELSAEVRKQILVISLFSLDSIILLTIFGIDAWLSGNKLLGTIEIVLMIVNFINYIILRKTANFKLSGIITVTIMILLCIYLLCLGGTKNTGPIWYFVLPNLIFYILGLKLGLTMLIILFSLTLFILYVPGNFFLQTEYPSAFVNRFMGSFLSVSILATVYEYMRKEGRKELLTLSRKLDDLSRKDTLTGISNRRDILEKLENELNRIERNNSSFSVLLIDIDHFKIVNDTYGHPCGDLILKKVAKTLSNNTQKRDIVARWGGEEFLIFLSETRLKEAFQIAERLRKAIENLLVNFGDKKISVTVSVGVSEYIQKQSIDDLIHNADTLLYQAKDEGRNRSKS